VRPRFSRAADVASRDKTGRTALHYAVGAGRMAVEVLLAAGSDVNAAGDGGHTATRSDRPRECHSYRCSLPGRRRLRRSRPHRAHSRRPTVRGKGWVHLGGPRCRESSAWVHLVCARDPVLNRRQQATHFSLESQTPDERPSKLGRWRRPLVSKPTLGDVFVVPTGDGLAGVGQVVAT
jgi:hypothetical protein